MPETALAVGNDIMRVDSIEVYSDATNAAVMRHPGRRFPGVLVQGDTLHGLWSDATEIRRQLKPGTPEHEDLGYFCNRLRSLVDHYVVTLKQHGIELPFSEP